jgi:hypothetical protein
MSGAALRRGERALSLLEVLVAAAILTLLVLAAASATLPLQRQASDSFLRLDQESRARRVLDGLRRELRQSGWGDDAGATPRFALWPETPDGAPVPLAGVTDRVVALELEMRTGLGAQDWSGPVRLTLVRQAAASGLPATLPRFRLVREADYDGDGTIAPGEALELARGLSDFVVTRPGAGQSLRLELELADPDPRWEPGAGPPPPIQQRFVDQVELRNGVRQ